MTNEWKLTFKDTPSNMNIKFESKIVPVINPAFDYLSLENKPQINGVTLQGNKTDKELNIDSIPNEEIESLFKSFV